MRTPSVQQRNARRRRRGTTLTSYALLVGLIAVVSVSSISALGERVDRTFVALEARVSAAKNYVICKRLDGTIRKADGHCFAYTGEQLAHAQGAQLCDELGGHLPTITTRKESEYFGTTIAGGQRAWIGLTDRDQEGTFQWVDGTQLNYTNWEAGEPNDQGGEDCVEINHNGLGKWNDQSCTDPRPIYCEIE